MAGISTTLALLFVASICSAFEFDLWRQGQPLGSKLFAAGETNEPLLIKAVVIDESEDNAGFERPQISGNRSPLSTRRLIQEPPLKKRHIEPRLIKEPPLKRNFAPMDLVYRSPYSVKKVSPYVSVPAIVF